MKASIRIENLLARSIPQQLAKCCLVYPVFSLTSSNQSTPPPIKSGASVPVQLQISCPGHSVIISHLRDTGCSGHTVNGLVFTGRQDLL